MFGRHPAFATIPKLKLRYAVFKLEAATRFPSILVGGSLIPIVVYRDGDGFNRAITEQYSVNKSAYIRAF